jgi:hypothetical protein
MSDKYGILIAEDGQSIRNARNKLDSRRRTLILDLEADPPHMQIVEVGGGNSYTDSGGTGRSQDLLFSMKHKLGFAPLVDCYFYVASVDNATTDSAVTGYGSQVYFLSGSAGTLADTVSFEATKEEFKLVHNFDKYGFTTGFVSPAPRYKFRVKFYIYSIDSGRAVNYGYGYDGEGDVIP